MAHKLKFKPAISPPIPVKMSRSWAMPNRNTFSIKPIKELIDKYAVGFGADPFAKDAKRATITNDLDPSTSAEFHLDAIDFIHKLAPKSLDYFLFDPPYSTRQVSECYKQLGRTVNMQTTQASFWANIKKAAAPKIKLGGYSLMFGWNSNGIGKCNGMEIVEILMVAHGGPHNDTIVTVEKKVTEPNGYEDTQARLDLYLAA